MLSKLYNYINENKQLCTDSLVLICFRTPLSLAQDGQNKASVSGGASFQVEPLWGTQIDPRWKAGEVIGDV